MKQFVIRINCRKKKKLNKKILMSIALRDILTQWHTYAIIVLLFYFFLNYLEENLLQ